MKEHSIDSGRIRFKT